MAIQTISIDFEDPNYGTSKRLVWDGEAFTSSALKKQTLGGVSRAATGHATGKIEYLPELSMGDGDDDDDDNLMI